jgi:hypothetical protein
VEQVLDAEVIGVWTGELDVQSVRVYELVR